MPCADEGMMPTQYTVPATAGRRMSGGESLNDGDAVATNPCTGLARVGDAVTVGVGLARSAVGEPRDGV